MDRRGSCRSPISFPETKGVDSYKDITPRMGVAYDLFGNGKTALKVNVGQVPRGREPCSSITSYPNPTLPAAPLDGYLHDPLA